MDGLCKRSDCELRKKNGIWICCSCDYGAGEDGRNRYLACGRGGCSHEVCSDCQAWEKDAVAVLSDKSETEESDMDESGGGDPQCSNEEDSGGSHSEEAEASNAESEEI